MKLDVKFDLSKFNLLEKFSKELKENVIYNGLDSTLNFSLSELKKDLNLYVNNIRTTPYRIGEPVKENGLEQPSINPPKAEADIINYLTKGRVDLTKYNNSKSFTDLAETGLLVGHNSKNQTAANRVTLKMNISSTDTVESHYTAAKKFINEAVFALPDANGNLKYYINPGYDLSEFVKIKCSTHTGDGNEKPKKGMSPAERFQKDSTRKRKDSDSPYAEWTLKQDAVSFIRQNFIDLTPVIENIKKGDFEAAQQIAQALDKKKATDISDQLQNLKQNKNINEPIKDYKNVLDIINNMKWAKKLTENRVEYVLVSSAYSADKDTDNVYEDLKKTIKQWAAIRNRDWWIAIVKKLKRLIGKYT